MTSRTMKEMAIQLGKTINYHYQETSDDQKYKLSVVSGITDVPAFRDSGFFEVAIIGTPHNNRVEELTIQIVKAGCGFNDVAKIQNKFRDNPSKLYKKIAKRTARAYT